MLRLLPLCVCSVVEVSVRDNGIGLSKEVAARIWEPFYQADLSTQRETGGAGLGLARVK